MEIAIPGTLTTAYLVLRMALGEFRYREVPFDRILDEVKSGGAQAGLVIHEGQLTYESEGLAKCLDLGEWWLLETGLPLPLGVNVARRDLGEEVLADVSAVLRESIQAGLAHRDEALRYALGFARGMDDQLADRFVGMYVNELTCDYGEEGREAVRELFARAQAAGALPEPVPVEFVG
jgi:1,4-dihydroxy-6-naphthoate synthase